MNKIILYFPKIRVEPEYNYFWSPQGLLSLASQLYTGYEVKIIDANVKKPGDEEMAGLLEDCICVGVSVMTGGGQITDALDFCSAVRRISPSIQLVWGGPHVTSLPVQTLRDDLVDLIVIGQGEYVFAELVKAIENGGSIEGVKGVGHKKNGEIVINEPAEFRRPVSLIDIPWELIDLKNYIRNDPTIGDKTVNLVSSAGCPFNCGFCYEPLAYGGKWKCCRAGEVLECVEYMRETYGVNGIKFYDANFFANKARVIEFADGLAGSSRKINWAASAHPQNILKMKSELKNLRESGCVRLLIGAESGSDEVLRYIGKNFVRKDILEIARICKKNDIVASFTFIAGFPVDAERERTETISLIEQINSKYEGHEMRIHLWAPYPGTRLYDEAIKLGFIPKTSLAEWSEYEYYKPQTPWLKQETRDLLNYTVQRQILRSDVRR
jgi:radical SAM superfamily enzyme YgiQ (UPF0313 family)